MTVSNDQGRRNWGQCWPWPPPFGKLCRSDPFKTSSALPEDTKVPLLNPKMSLLHNFVSHLSTQDEFPHNIYNRGFL